MSENLFKAAVFKYVKKEIDPTATEVTSVQQEKRSTGFCDTCYFEYEEVVVNYNTPNGIKTYTYYGDMADFIKDLL